MTEASRHQLCDKIEQRVQASSVITKESGDEKEKSIIQCLLI